MKIIDRLNKLPEPILSRVLQIMKEQHRSHVLNRWIGVKYHLTIHEVIHVGKTTEGREYWNEINTLYFDKLQEVTDQEYLIYTMSDAFMDYSRIDEAKDALSRASTAFSLGVRDRRQSVVSLRNALWCYCYVNFEVSLHFIARHTNPKHPFNHTTVLHGINRHKELLKLKDDLTVRAEEKIRNFINKSNQIK